MATKTFPTSIPNITPVSADRVLLSQTSTSGSIADSALSELPISTATQSALDAKQATLVSATNIKTINGVSVLGTGDLVVSWGGGDMVLATAQTNTGLKTFLNGTFGLRNIANTITSLFSSAATVARTYTLKDADGTLAFTSDITGTNSGTNTGDQTTVTGNAGTATTLQTARTIAWVSFNGSENIAIASTDLSDTALLARLASPTFTGTVVLPSWQALITPALGTPTSGVMTNCTGLPVAGGGTGVETLTANGILFGNGTSAVGITAVGTATHVLTSNGEGVAPTFQAAGGGGWATDIIQIRSLI